MPKWNENDWELLKENRTKEKGSQRIEKTKISVFNVLLNRAYSNKRGRFFFSPFYFTFFSIELHILKKRTIHLKVKFAV